jgi:hypothetical protein
VKDEAVHVDQYAIRHSCVSAVGTVTEVRAEYPPGPEVICAVASKLPTG